MDAEYVYNESLNTPWVAIGGFFKGAGKTFVTLAKEDCKYLFLRDKDCSPVEQMIFFLASPLSLTVITPVMSLFYGVGAAITAVRKHEKAIREYDPKNPAKQSTMQPV